MISAGQATRQLLLFFSLHALLWGGASDWRVILCVPEDPAHEMNVTWRVSEQMDSARVQFMQNSPLAKLHKLDLIEKLADMEQLILPDSTTVFAYSVTMKALEPGTQYVYRVGTQNKWSEWFVFKTAEKAAAPFTFIYLGDPQNGLMSALPRTFRAAYQAAPNAAFMTMAGDLVSVPDDDQQWEDYFHAGGWIFGMLPQVPVMGNHAYYWGRAWQKQHSIYWRPHFKLPENGLKTLPETNYFFHYQGVLFVVLNGSEQRAEQAAWLDELLERDQSTWFILSMHQPLYSTKAGRDGTKLREHFLPVIDKHGVDLVLQGHDHTFGRTYPLVGGEKAKRRQKGTIYINSVSGSKQYGLGPAKRDLFAITGSDTQYYHLIDVGKKTLTLRSYSVDDALVDEVQIQSVKRN